MGDRVCPGHFTIRAGVANAKNFSQRRSREKFHVFANSELRPISLLGSHNPSIVLHFEINFWFIRYLFLR